MRILSRKQTVQCIALHESINYEENAFADIMSSIYERQHRQPAFSSSKQRFLHRLWGLFKKNTKTKFKAAASSTMHHAAEENVMVSSTDEDDDKSVVTMTSMTTMVDANIEFIAIIGDWLQQRNNVFDEIVVRITKEEEMVQSAASRPCSNNSSVAVLHDEFPEQRQQLMSHEDNDAPQPQPQPQKQQCIRRHSGTFRQTVWKFLTKKMKNRRIRRLYEERGGDNGNCSEAAAATDSNDDQTALIQCIDIADGLQRHGNVFDAIMDRICVEECQESSDVISSIGKDGNRRACSKDKDTSRRSVAANDDDCVKNADPSSSAAPCLGSSHNVCHRPSKLQRLGSTVGRVVKKMLCFKCSNCSRASVTTNNES